MQIPLISIIGAGNMGRSLINGLIKSGHPADKIWVTDPDENKLNSLHQTCFVHTTIHNIEAAQMANVLILAIKPQLVANVTSELASTIHSQKPLIISIAAGIRTASIQRYVGNEIAIVRAMPNMPALIGCGVSALYANPTVTKDQRHLAESIMGAVSFAVWVEKESEMDIVTALSGSGPAYFFLMMEALQDAAEQLGLPKETARLLTLHTALGSSRMAVESDQSLVALRRAVTSPGGTTEKAISVLEEHHLRDVFKKTVTAAKLRSEELANLGEKKTS